MQSQPQSCPPTPYIRHSRRELTHVTIKTSLENRRRVSQSVRQMSQDPPALQISPLAPFQNTEPKAKRTERFTSFSTYKPESSGRRRARVQGSAHSHTEDRPLQRIHRALALFLHTAPARPRESIVIQHCHCLNIPTPSCLAPGNQGPCPPGTQLPCIS